MSILKYKDPKTGEFKRINPYKADLSFVGKDGITVNKATDSEKVEISGSGCVQKNTDLSSGADKVYGQTFKGFEIIYDIGQNSATENTIARRTVYGTLRTNTPTHYLDCINKKYVDDNYVKKVKFTNLEQALNGYILDTTKEAYADLDSAVLKNSVAVGDNVYPIADKTRALVTRIEGKSTKMVQLLDKSTFPATKTEDGITYTNNGDGTITVNGTATAVTAYVAPDFRMVLGHKYLLIGCPLGGSFGHGYTHSIHQKDSNGETKYWADNGEGKIFTSVGTSGLWVLAVYLGNPTVDNKLFMPNLFDLTAMNREDITTVEQFKAEFPELYPYENGNIYPAKISGVKFYENQDKSGEQASVTLPETYDLHGIGDYKDYLEITKNENNELYTLKKVQNIKSVDLGTLGWNYGNNQFYTIKIQSIHSYSPSEVADIFCAKYTTTSKNAISSGCISSHESDQKYITIIDEDYTDSAAFKESLSGVMLYYALATPVETVIATNFTYEQMTAVRHNGGLIEVESNVNKGYARPTIKNTIVYRLTATNKAEG